jgi:putative ABC transport system ATP-binding protein
MDQDRPVYACRGIDMKVDPGEFIGILGPSGSGKSSLLYLLSGLKIPTSGAVTYEGRELAGLNDADRSRLRLEDFGFVFQHPYLLGYLSALENVVIGSRRTVGAGSGQAGPRSNGGSALAEAAELLERLGLGAKMRRLPHELSMGERQRVCVARALLGNPKAIFADEPTAALDHANGLHVVEMLNEHRAAGALVMVTHDPSMLDSADRVLKLADGALEAS